MRRLLLSFLGTLLVITPVALAARDKQKKAKGAELSTQAPVQSKTILSSVGESDTKIFAEANDGAAQNSGVGKSYSVQGEGFVVDGVAAVVFGQEGTQIITKAEVKRPSLTGALRPLDDVVFERRVFLDALKHKIAIDDEVIDRYLAVVQRQNNLTAEAMRQVFANAGYTYEEGRQQFKILQVVSQMVDYKIRSNLIVPRKDVEAYHHAHPEVEEASYDLQYIEEPFEADLEKQKRRLAKIAKEGAFERSFVWPEPFAVKDSQIAESKKFIKKMKVGDYYGPLKLEESFGIYHLVGKKDARELTLEERYQDIVETLRQPRYEELLEEYRDNLAKSTSVLYL